MPGYVQRILIGFDKNVGKNVVKRKNLKQITFKTSKSLFQNKQIAPITLYLKTTFSPISLFVKSDKSESLLPLVT